MAGIILVNLGSAREKARIAKGLQFSQNILSALGDQAVGIWDFDEGSGNTVSDRSGNDNGGTITGASWTSEGDTPSKKGYALSFDGSGDYVLIPGTSDLDLQDMTISCWNYSSNYDRNMFMFEKTTNGSVNTQYPLFYSAGGSNHQIYFRTYGLSSRDLSVTDHPNGPINGQWNHIVATYNSSTDIKKIYCNGIEIASASNITGTINTSPAGTSWIGTYGGGVGYPFNGKIDEVRIYSKVLTSAEIQKLYVEGLKTHPLAEK